MEGDKQHFWHTVLYFFKKGKNATEMQKKICAVYGESAVTDEKCQKGFASFLLLLTFWPIILCPGAILCIGRCLAELYPLEANSWRLPTYSKHPNQ